MEMGSLPLQKTVFKSQRGIDSWLPLIKYIEKNGHKVFDHPEECDISVVLSGKFENPNCFYGERILLFHNDEWKGFHCFFYKILTRYYDKIIDVTKYNLGDTLAVIENATKREINKF